MIVKIIEPSPCGTVTPTYEAMFEERAVPVRSVQLSSLWTAVMSNWRRPAIIAWRSEMRTPGAQFDDRRPRQTQNV